MTTAKLLADALGEARANFGNYASLASLVHSLGIFCGILLVLAILADGRGHLAFSASSPPLSALQV